MWQIFLEFCRGFIAVFAAKIAYYNIRDQGK
jgi:hypothetical protein